VPGGDGFSAEQRFEIDRAIRAAETMSRYEFSVFVGASEGDPGSFARRLHAALSAPARSVLVLVDPTARALEIVTGAVVRRDLPDEAVRAAAIEMQAAFAEGDLVGGIQRGVTQLAEAAVQSEARHV